MSGDGVSGAGRGNAQQQLLHANQSGAGTAKQRNATSTGTGAKDGTPSRQVAPGQAGIGGSSSQPTWSSVPKTESNSRNLAMLGAIFKLPAYQKLSDAHKQAILIYLGNHLDRIDAVAQALTKGRAQTADAALAQAQHIVKIREALDCSGSKGFKAWLAAQNPGVKAAFDTYFSFFDIDPLEAAARRPSQRDQLEHWLADNPSPRAKDIVEVLSGKFGELSEDDQRLLLDRTLHRLGLRDVGELAEGVRGNVGVRAVVAQRLLERAIHLQSGSMGEGDGLSGEKHRLAFASAANALAAMDGTDLDELGQMLSRLSNGALFVAALAGEHPRRDTASLFGQALTALNTAPITPASAQIIDKIYQNILPVDFLPIEETGVPPLSRHQLAVAVARVLHPNPEDMLQARDDAQRLETLLDAPQGRAFFFGGSGDRNEATFAAFRDDRRITAENLARNYTGDWARHPFVTEAEARQRLAAIKNAAPDENDVATIERFSGILQTAAGQGLAYSGKVPAKARAEAWLEINDHPEITRATFENAKDPWQVPELQRLIAARYQKIDTLRFPAAAMPFTDENAVANLVGLTFGREPKGLKLNAADLAELRRARAEGRLPAWVTGKNYFAGDKDVERVTENIVRAGGGTFPIQVAFQSVTLFNEYGPIKCPCFQIEAVDAAGRPARAIVDNTGAVYRDSYDTASEGPRDRVVFTSAWQHWAAENHLPAGTVWVSGQSYGETPAASSKVKNALDTAALVGCLVAGVAIIGLSDGTAAPILVPYAVQLLGGGWMTYRSGSELVHRYTHDLSLTDRDAVSLWLGTLALPAGSIAGAGGQVTARLARAGMIAKDAAQSGIRAFEVGGKAAFAAMTIDQLEAALRHPESLTVASLLQLAFLGLSAAAPMPVDTFKMPGGAAPPELPLSPPPELPPPEPLPRATAVKLPPAHPQNNNLAVLKAGAQKSVPHVETGPEHPAVKTVGNDNAAPEPAQWAVNMAGAPNPPLLPWEIPSPPKPNDQPVPPKPPSPPKPQDPPPPRRPARGTDRPPSKPSNKNTPANAANERRLAELRARLREPNLSDAERAKLMEEANAILQAHQAGVGSENSGGPKTSSSNPGHGDREINDLARAVEHPAALPPEPPAAPTPAAQDGIKPGDPSIVPIWDLRFSPRSAKWDELPNQSVHDTVPLAKAETAAAADPAATSAETGPTGQAAAAGATGGGKGKGGEHGSGGAGGAAGNGDGSGGSGGSSGGGPTVPNFAHYRWLYDHDYEAWSNLPEEIKADPRSQPKGPDGPPDEFEFDPVTHAGTAEAMGASGREPTTGAAPASAAPSVTPAPPFTPLLAPGSMVPFRETRALIGWLRAAIKRDRALAFDGELRNWIAERMDVRLHTGNVRPTPTNATVSVGDFLKAVHRCAVATFRGAEAVRIMILDATIAAIVKAELKLPHDAMLSLDALAVFTNDPPPPPPPPNPPPSTSSPTPGGGPGQQPSANESSPAAPPTVEASGGAEAPPPAPGNPETPVAPTVGLSPVEIQRIEGLAMKAERAFARVQQLLSTAVGPTERAQYALAQPTVANYVEAWWTALHAIDDFAEAVSQLDAAQQAAYRARIGNLFEYFRALPSVEDLATINAGRFSNYIDETVPSAAELEDLHGKIAARKKDFDTAMQTGSAEEKQAASTLYHKALMDYFDAVARAQEAERDRRFQLQSQIIDAVRRHTDGVGDSATVEAALATYDQLTMQPEGARQTANQAAPKAYAGAKKMIEVVNKLIREQESEAANPRLSQEDRDIYAQEIASLQAVRRFLKERATPTLLERVAEQLDHLERLRTAQDLAFRALLDDGEQAPVEIEEVSRLATRSEEAQNAYEAAKGNASPLTRELANEIIKLVYRNNNGIENSAEIDAALKAFDQLVGHLNAYDPFDTIEPATVSGGAIRLAATVRKTIEAAEHAPGSNPAHIDDLRQIESFLNRHAAEAAAREQVQLQIQQKKTEEEPVDN
jgi:hypothetical protein